MNEQSGQEMGGARALFCSVLLQSSLYKGFFYLSYQTASQCSLCLYTLYQSTIPQGFVSPRGFSLKAADSVAKNQCAQSNTRSGGLTNRQGGKDSDNKEESRD